MTIDTLRHKADALRKRISSNSCNGCGAMTETQLFAIELELGELYYLLCPQCVSTGGQEKFVELSKAIDTFMVGHELADMTRGEFSLSLVRDLPTLVGRVQ
jgi:hypothetical protein